MVFTYSQAEIEIKFLARTLKGTKTTIIVYFENENVKNYPRNRKGDWKG